ncbi:hypothetical protein HYV87_03930 [Candidatus Woesearchaeota archaeon]|nr:hypothetical protein [Candidatus Woesearchaeota archaeon]MBI2582244.1 hypothetical protein [Candidatus Woesearchaeota archaeon]
MFRFNSRKGHRERNDNGLTGMLLHHLEKAEELVDADLERGHDQFIRAQEIYDGLLLRTGKEIPDIDRRLDELYVDYQMRIDRLNLNSTP